MLKRLFYNGFYAFKVSKGEGRCEILELYNKYILYLQYVRYMCIVSLLFNKYINIMESKEDKFKRLANSRVNNAIKQLDLIGNLSNLASYDYSDDEVRKIMGTLSQKIKEINFKFQKNLKKDSFRL